MLIDKKYKINIIDIFVGIFILCFNFISIYLYMSRNVNMIDFGINRSACGYVLYGYNPMELVCKEPVVEGLHYIPFAFGNVPYGLLLGNIFYFGFLPYNVGLICFYVETIILYITTLFLVSNYFYKYYRNSYYKNLIFYFVIYSFLSINIIGSIRIGNAGHMLCMLLVLAIIFVDDNKLLSGICLSFAMMKPQLALPICFVMLLYKKITPLFIAASIDIIASIIVACIINKNVFSLFIDSLNVNMNLNAYPYYGILSIFNVDSPSGTLFYSMIFGLVLIILCYFLLKNNNSNFVKFYCSILIGSFWSYSWSSDHYIIIIPVMVMILFFLLYKNIYIKLFFLFSSLFLNFNWMFKSFLRGFRYIYNFFNITTNEFYTKTYANTFVYTIFIIILFVSLYFINKYDIENN